MAYLSRLRGFLHLKKIKKQNVLIFVQKKFLKSVDSGIYEC